MRHPHTAQPRHAPVTQKRACVCVCVCPLRLQLSSSLLDADRLTLTLRQHEGLEVLLRKVKADLRRLLREFIALDSGSIGLPPSTARIYPMRRDHEAQCVAERERG